MMGEDRLRKGYEDWNKIQKSFFIIGLMSFVYGGVKCWVGNFYYWTDEIDLVLSFVLIIGSGLGLFLFKDDK